MIRAGWTRGLEAYARLLVDCIAPEPGWQVLVRSQPPARPLIEEVSRELGRRGARALARLGFDSVGRRLRPRGADRAARRALPDRDQRDRERRLVHGDRRPGEHAATARTSRPSGPGSRQQAMRRHHGPTWPTRSRGSAATTRRRRLAQDAGMSVRAFEDFLYGAVLVDWEALRQTMERIAERFDRASAVRIVGEGTDLTFSLEGREGKVDALGANMPGGEIFYSPVEDSAEGVISYLGVPGVLPRSRGRRRPLPLRGRPDRRGLRDERRGLPDRHARHRRGRAPAGRVRDRLQPRHPAAREEHPLRREDGGDDPPRDRHRLPPARRQEHERGALGHGQGAAKRRADRAGRRGRPGERASGGCRPADRASTRACSSSGRSASSPAGRC